MNPDILKHYLADSPPSVVPLAIKPHFEALNDQEKLYAHYISVSVHPAPVRRATLLTVTSACFAGTRIVLRQVSPESEHIYDFIIALYKHGKGDLKKVQKDAGLSDDDSPASRGTASGTAVLL